MGDGSLVPAAEAPAQGWALTKESAVHTQGLVVSPFSHLEFAQALFLVLPKNTGAWLGKLRADIPITDATGQTSPCAAIAFTWSGLQMMGLDDTTLATFSTPFQEGMHQIDRQRRLSDAPEFKTCIPDGPIWSGNIKDPYPEDTATAAAATKMTVHAVLLLYAQDEDALGKLVARAEEALLPNGVAISFRIPLSLRLDANGIGREHFGFADGVSQPVLYDPTILPSSSYPRDPWHAVAVGDILMGHVNAHGEAAPGPLLGIPADGTASSIKLPTDGAPPGFFNLGLNGSYLVVRELRQDVAAFWQSMDGAAKAIGDAGIDGDWLAARVMGRDKDGNPLKVGGVMPKEKDQPANAFGFIQDDPQGFGCPMGSHMRRANPRDGLAQDAKGGPGLLQAANNHRILRRGRKFGSTIADLRVDDGQERGLLFMCLNTDIVRQFEFVQQTWMLNPSFCTLYDETDPLAGPAGPFTIPATPLRLRPQVDTFVRLAGGEYFFLPSLPALDYFVSLAPKPAVVTPGDAGL